MRSLRSSALVLLVVAACAEQNTPIPDNSEGAAGDSSSDGGKVSTAGKTSIGGKVATGGSATNTAGKTATGGDTNAGGEPSAGTGGSGGAGGKASGGTGGKASGGSGGTGGKASGGSGGTGGKGGSAGSGSGSGGGGSGSTGGSGCTPSTSSPMAGISARYEPEKTTASGTAIGAKLMIANTSGSPVDLGALKLRYYMTNEVTADVHTMINWTYFRPNPAGNQTTGSSVSASLVKLTCKSGSADSYLEFTFGAGSLAAGFQIYFSWTATNDATQNFNQANDYSFDAAAVQGTDDMKITVHKTDGSLVWGTEP